jgi:hypothetical protein
MGKFTQEKNTHTEMDQDGLPCRNLVRAIPFTCDNNKKFALNNE